MAGTVTQTASSEGNVRRLTFTCTADAADGSFPATDATTRIEGRLLKLGKTLAVGDFTIWSDGKAEPVAHATVTYAIPPKA